MNKNEHAGEVKRVNKINAGYAMTFDLIANLTKIMNEKEAINQILDLFTMLFAPKELIYISLLEDKLESIKTRPDHLEKTANINALLNLPEDYHFMESGKGFIVRITHQQQLIGILSVDSVSFPEYLEHYYNLSVAISQVCGMAISNSRAYEKIIQFEEELKESKDNLEKQVEKRTKELKKSEKKFRSLVESSRDYIMLYDKECRHLYENPAALKVAGMTEEDIIGKTHREIGFDPSLCDMWERTIRKVFATGEAAEKIFEWESVNEKVFLNWRLTPVFDETEKVETVLGISTDISELKKAEEERDRFFTLSTDLLCVAGSDGYFKRVNPGFEKILGFTKEELVSKPFMEFIHPEDRERTAKEVEEELKGKTVLSFENRYLCKDGSVRNLHWNAFTVMEEGLIYAIAHDITESKRTEKRILESEKRFRELVENISEVFWMENLEGTELLYVSPAYEKIWGRTCQSFYDNPEEWIDAIHPEDRKRVIDSFNSGRLNGTYSQEFRIIRPDGSIRWIWDRSVLIKDSAGKVLRIAGIAQEITERKKMEEKLRETQKLESLGILAGGIAHDFNNILTGILGNSDLAFDDLSSTSPVRNYIEEIQKGGKRAAELCHLMLAYSGKGKFVIENVDVNEIIKEVTNMLEVSISKKHSIKNDLIENLPSVDVDITQIRQVIMNLIINASEAIGDNNGVISVSTGTVECGSEGCQLDKSTVLDDVLPMGEYVVIEVTDTGVGMDKATINKIFDPFFTTKFTGRGLGMSAVLGIIRGHKGSINVESEPGKGTKFKVFLPTSSETSSTTKSDSEETEAPWKGSGTVLVVDDEETVRDVAKKMLGKMGLKVISACDGLEAMEICRERSNTIDSVILDLTMPRMSGKECFSELRKIRKDIPILICSGFSEDETAKKFVGQGVNEFLQKPFRLKTLKNKMRKILK